MTAAEIKALRAALGCSTRDLAKALGIEQEEVLSWERGDTFPTKRAVDRMAALQAAGPSGIPRKPRAGVSVSPLQSLADPEVWIIFRKLLVHAELRKRVSELAADYEDPNAER